MQIVVGRAYFDVRDFRTIREMFAQSVALYSDRVAVVSRARPDSEPQRITYRQYAADRDALYLGLAPLCREGSRIAVLGANSYRWMLSYLAAVSGLGVVVPLDPMLPAHEVRSLLERSRVDIFIYDAAKHADFAPVLTGLPHLRHCLPMNRDRLSPSDQQVFDQLLADAQALPSAGAQAAEILKPLVFTELESVFEQGRTLAEGGAKPAFPEIDPEAMAALLFTSGTTSQSKGVMLANRCICSDIQAIVRTERFIDEVQYLSILPLHHTFANTCDLLTTICLGASVHICDGLRYIQKNMNEYGIDMLSGVPALFRNFYKHILAAIEKQGRTALVERLRRITRALRIIHIDLRGPVFKKIRAGFGGRFHVALCGAAALEPEIVQFFEDIGVRIIQGYGLTETSPVAIGCNPFVFLPDSIGHPLAGVEVAIDTDTPGEPGEILIRSPIVMLGYYENPEATAEAIDADGWLHTGDIGTLSPADGHIRVTGRLKSMIVLPNGKKVFPEELEQLINRFAWIRDSMVFGQDHQGDTLIGVRLVVDKERLEADGEATDDASLRSRIEALIASVNSRLPSFKSIRIYLYGFENMIMTTSLKVRRNLELERITRYMTDQRLRWQDLNGRNLDAIQTPNGQQQ